jgi:hypothetical protein
VSSLIGYIIDHQKVGHSGGALKAINFSQLGSRKSELAHCNLELHGYY